MSIKSFLALLAAFGLIAAWPHALLAAGSEIIRLEYRECVDTDDYTLTTTNLYRELRPANVPAGTLSDTWGLGATHILTVTFTNDASVSQFCVESTPVLGSYWAPWAAMSDWQTAGVTNVYSFGVIEGCRFVRIRAR